MPSSTQTFRISVHFLCDTFHGRGDGGANEWPPSPLRLFEALVNAASRLEASPWEALRWLEAQPLPIILAPRKATIQPHERGYKTYVPDNVGDLVAKSWTAGRDSDIASYRAEKRIRPVNLDDRATVHYIWENVEETSHPLLDALISTVRAISAFGWGVDLVVADAAVGGDVQTGQGNDRWVPADTGSIALRVPVSGTLDALKIRYTAFCDRISLEKDAVFKPVPPLTAFRIVGYRRASDISEPYRAVFALRKLDDLGFASFDPVRRGLHLAGMCRHLAASPDFIRAMGWSPEQAGSVLGHGDTAGRIDFIPLPSIEWQGEEKGDTLGTIRRVLVRMPADTDSQEFTRIVRFLEGGELVDEKTGKAVAFLRRERQPARAVQPYLSQASEWASVTPVILPGYDDRGGDRTKLRDKTGVLSAEEKNVIVSRLDRRIEYLLRKALRQAGIPEALVAAAQFDWRGSGFRQGVDIAANYAVPAQHRRYRRLHVRIVWREKDDDGMLKPTSLSGPFCFGGGRHSGLGLFVPVVET